MLLDSIPTPFPLSPPTTSLLNDIFSTSRSPSPTSPSHSPSSFPNLNSSPNLHHHHYIASEPSDIPHLRSQHVTSGYRDGIASSREAALQGGFDEGYTLGAVMGLRVGWLIGVLEGVDAALRAGRERGKGGDRGTAVTAIGEVIGEADVEAEVEVEKQQQISTDTVTKEISTLLKRAREELHLTCLFSAEYWSADGVWTYEVKSKPVEKREEREESKSGEQNKLKEMDMEEEEVTFEEVADQHPLVKTWRGEVERLMRRAGIRARVWEGEEWERGRVK